MRAEAAALPAGPARSAAWQLVRYSLAPLPFLEECSRRFGDPFTIRLAGFGSLVMLTEAEAVKDVLRGGPEALHSGEGNEFLSVTVGRSSVLVLDEEPHARQRRLLLPPMRGERMRAFFDTIEAVTREVIDAWPAGSPRRMDAPMRKITLRVILQVVFGRESLELQAALERKFERIVGYSRTRFALILLKASPHWLLEESRWMPYYRELRQLDELLFALIDEHRRMPETGRSDGILTDLLAATHEDGRPMSHQEIRDAIVTLVVAGYETTSIALMWALAEIVPREDVVEKVRAQIAQAKGGGPLRAESLDGMEYLDAAIRESLRLRTILPFVVRLTKRPFKAGGREYPAGILLCPCNHLVHRQPDLYPDPDRFRPERFIERKFAAHEWFPFGGGNRTCLGMAFALHEMKVVLATVLTRVQLARVPGARSRPLRQGITLAPHDGAAMLVASRTGRD
jgi:cytochrome P450